MRYSLAHGAYEGLAYAFIQPGDEEQQVCTLKQFVYDPRGMGIEWPGLVTGTLKERTEGATYHGVCAEDGYGCWLALLLHFWVGSLDERSSGAVPLDREGGGALCPDPLVVVVCFTSLDYLSLKSAEICEPSFVTSVTL